MNGDVKTCEMCGHEFLCNPYNVSNCQCSQIVLSGEAKQYAKTHYTDCLCLTCLKKINEKFKVA